MEKLKQKQPTVFTYRLQGLTDLNTTNMDSRNNLTDEQISIRVSKSRSLKRKLFPNEGQTQSLKTFNRGLTSSLPSVSRFKKETVSSIEHLQTMITNASQNR